MTLTSLGAVVWSTLLARWSDTRASRRPVLLLAAARGALGYLGYATLTRALSLLVLLGCARATRAG